MKKCKQCGKEFTGKAINFCSRNCYYESRKGVKLNLSDEEIERRRNVGKNNKGRKLSDETKRKIGDASKNMWSGPNGDYLKNKLSERSSHPRSDEVKEKIRLGNKGKKRPYNAKRNKENPPHLGCKHTEETKQKISYGVSGKKNGMYGKKPKFKINVIYENKSGLKINMRSTWEAKFAKYLDDSNLTWFYEHKTFELSNGKTYTPDFYIKEWDMYIEIKGYPHEESIEKYELFNNEYPFIKNRILFKKELLNEFKIKL